MVKQVKVMRGDPVVMPLAACQCLDHVVRLALARPNTDLPTLTSLRARFVKTCVAASRYSSLYSLLVPVAAGCCWLPRPNGSQSRPAEIFPITRVRVDSW